MGHQARPERKPTPLTALSRTALPKRPIIWGNLLFLTLFAVAAISATAWYQLTVGITWRELTAGLAIWALTGLGITAGYHRLFAHRAYKAHATVRLALAMLGGAAIQNSAIAWCTFIPM